MALDWANFNLQRELDHRAGKLGRLGSKLGKFTKTGQGLGSFLGNLVPIPGAGLLGGWIGGKLGRGLSGVDVEDIRGGEDDLLRGTGQNIVSDIKGDEIGGLLKMGMEDLYDELKEKSDEDDDSLFDEDDDFLFDEGESAGYAHPSTYTPYVNETGPQIESFYDTPDWLYPGGGGVE